MRTFLLYLVTALAEIVGCSFAMAFAACGGEPGCVRVAADLARGRVYAAYGGVYPGVAIIWLWVVDGIHPSARDVEGVAVALAGMSIIAFQPH